MKQYVKSQFEESVLFHENMMSIEAGERHCDFPWRRKVSLTIMYHPPGVVLSHKMVKGKGGIYFHALYI